MTSKKPAPQKFTSTLASAAQSTIAASPPVSQNGAHPVGGKDYSETDAGNAERLLDRYGENLLCVAGRKHPWRVWDGNCWLSDATKQVDGLMEDTMRDALAAQAQGYTPRHQLQGRVRWLTQSLDTARIRAALEAASRRVSVTPDLFDRDPWLLACANGLTYDLRNGSLRASRREDYLSRCVPVAAEETPVAHPTWDTVLRLVMDDDPEMVKYLRQVFGLMLTGDVSEKCFWFFVGETNRGKTTVLKFMSLLLGDYAYKIPLRGLLKRYGDPGIRHDLAGLQGVRFAYAEEFKPGDVLDVGVMKEISGDSDITADRKGENNETFKCRAKLVLGTNAVPNITDIDDAIRGRVRVVPFEVDIPERFKELGLPLLSVDEVGEALLAEAPGILQDLVAAVGEWRAAGGKLVMPAKVRAATQVYLDDQDPLVPWIATCCESPTDGVPAPQVEEPFALWYASFLRQSGRDPRKATKHWFGRQLEAHKFLKREAYNGKFYTGPRLTDVAKHEAEAALFDPQLDGASGRHWGGRGRLYGGDD